MATSPEKQEIEAAGTHDEHDASEVANVEKTKEGDHSQEETVSCTRSFTRRAKMAMVKDEYSKYIPLHRAVVRGEWEFAKRIFKEDSGAVTARINNRGETALHVAVGAGKRAIDFVEELVNLMPIEGLELTDIHGGTALYNAAGIGNTNAATILLQKNPASLYIRSKIDYLPIHNAAQNGHKDTLRYLWTVTKDHDDVQLPPNDGVRLLIRVISYGFYDIALDMVRRYSHLAKTQLDNGDSALGEICKKVSAFPSGSRLNGWQRLIYSYVPVKLEKCADKEDHHHRGDIENPVNSSQVIAHDSTWARSLVECFSIFVPHMKHIRQQKLMHLQARELVKCLFQEINSLNEPAASLLLYRTPFFTATRLGIYEVLEEIVDTFPEAIWTYDSENHNMFQLAVIHRCEHVFNLVYQMSDHGKQHIAPITDSSGNNILHLAGRLPDKLNLLPSAALQMQRELQWFKEVEKLVNPNMKEWQNKDGDTPAMVFTKSHENLAKGGEKWMNKTANSCTIVAALIATIAFAAAITVPGGNNSANGLPFFSKETAFIIFAISDAMSLFTSTTSLLMFLSILTSGYAEGDFLYVLPKRLIIGLFTLFLSITTMIIAFSSTLYLVFCQKDDWILIPMAVISSLPIYFFVSLQFPLLVYLISSTYGRGIFGKQSDRPFY